LSDQTLPTSEVAVQPAAHSGRILYADLLRIAAIATVVILHVSSGLAGQYGALRLDWWWVGNIVDSLTRWSVPVFIMLSGMLLLGHSKDLPIGAFLRKRFGRVFIPYAIWALAIYVPWKAWVERQPFSLGQTVSDFLRGSTYYHLWFIYTIMNTYLIAPIVRIVVDHASDAALRYYLWLWFACLTLTSLLPKFLNVTLGFSVEMANGFVGYFVLGYYFDRVDVSPRFRRAVYALAAVCAAITILGTAHLSAGKGSLDDWFYAYLIPTTAVIAAAVFLAFRYTEWPRFLERPAAVGLIATLSAATFGIYFVHPMILWALGSGAFGGVTVGPTALGSPWLGIPLTSLVTFVLGFVIVQVIRRIPYGKYLLP
jgi:surface polysaccharide O-acyltransferase-like enzyme